MEVVLKQYKKLLMRKILDAKVVVVITNNTNAGVLEKAESYNIDILL
jgi:phosphoribosylglycinamide formyltransferase-1